MAHLYPVPSTPRRLSNCARRRWPAAGLALAVLLMGGAPAIPEAGGNLIKNAGFEAGGTPPAEWYFDTKLSDRGRVALAPSPVHGGRLALSLEPNAANTDSAKPLAVGQAVPAAAFRGKPLYVSAWMAARGGARAVVGLFAISKTGEGKAGLTIEQESAPGAMQRSEDVFYVPDDKDAELLILFCSVQGTSGQVFFDDVVLSAEAPAHLATNKADPGPPLPVRVTVDAGRTLRTIPRTLYGINTEWIWNGNGMWEADKQALQPEIVRLTRALGVSLIRFPGGTFSDFYHWRDGIGPQAGRAETQHMAGADKSRHVLGTDEMLEFARRSGGRLLLTANGGSGTAEEAADWVRYVNGRAGKAGRVGYWEVGNELYINDGSPASNAVTLPPERYAERCAQFIRAMRRADPAIKIGAIGDENYWHFRSYKDWTRTVLARVGGEIDFLAVHNAYAPLVVTDNGRSVREVYAAMLAAPLLVRRSLDTVSAQIAALGPKPAGRVKIAVTEWGPLFHILPSSRWVDHCKTLGSALYTASVMKAFLETPRVEIATFFKLVDALFIGAIGKRGEAFVPNASYYALQLYTRHFGSVLVRSTATSPTYDSRSVGWVKAVRNVPYCEVVSSRSADGKVLYVLAINKHFDRAMRARISLRGFHPSGQGTAWTLGGTGIDANTGTAPLQVPGITWGKQAEAQPNPRFSRGGPGEVQLTRQPLQRLSRNMGYTFPPHSVTCLEINGHLP